MTPEQIDQLAWDKMNGLLPAVVQDEGTLQVLMLGYMNRDALAATLGGPWVTFYSRSKERLWVKGETSGHKLRWSSIEPDCDGDALLVRAEPLGPTCHLDATSCFGAEHAPGLGFLGHLSRVIASRAGQDPATSYTASLLASGVHRMAQKVGEEGVEVALAAKDEATGPLAQEAADLVYHLLVLLRGKGVPLDDILKILRKRHHEP